MPFMEQVRNEKNFNMSGFITKVTTLFQKRKYEKNYRYWTCPTKWSASGPSRHVSFKLLFRLATRNCQAQDISTQYKYLLSLLLLLHSSYCGHASLFILCSSRCDTGFPRNEIQEQFVYIRLIFPFLFLQYIDYTLLPRAQLPFMPRCDYLLGAASSAPTKISQYRIFCEWYICRHI